MTKSSETVPEITAPVIQVRGKPKSGRVWKEVQTKRSSAKEVFKPKKTTWEVKMQEKMEKKAIKEMETKVIQFTKDKKKEIRRKREQKLKWKTDNEKKSSVFQVITNTDKIKKMSKKQLLSLRKMDTNKMLSNRKY